MRWGTLRCLVTCRYFYCESVMDMLVVSLLGATVWLHDIDETARSP